MTTSSGTLSRRFVTGATLSRSVNRSPVFLREMEPTLSTAAPAAVSTHGRTDRRGHCHARFLFQSAAPTPIARPPISAPPTPHSQGDAEEEPAGSPGVSLKSGRPEILAEE